VVGKAWAQDVLVYAFHSSGEVLGSHMSSNRSWGRYDIGERRAAEYAAKYPQGYIFVDLIDMQNPLENPDFAAVYERNQELGRKAEAANAVS
jgi:hypothetical protein